MKSSPNLLKAEQYKKPPVVGREPFYHILPAEAENESIVEVNLNPDLIAEQALSAAKQDIERMKNQAHMDGYREGKEAGYQEGHQEGYEEGFSTGKQEGFAAVLETERSGVEETLQQMQTVVGQSEAWIAGLKAEVVQLALAVAEKVLQDELTTSPERMEKLALEVLHTYREETPLVLTVSPRLKAYLVQSETFRSVVESITASVEVRSSDAFTDGDCILDTPSCQVDAGVQEQLRRIRKKLTA